MTWLAGPLLLPLIAAAAQAGEAAIDVGKLHPWSWQQSHRILPVGFSGDDKFAYITTVGEPGSTKSELVLLDLRTNRSMTILQFARGFGRSLQPFGEQIAAALRRHQIVHLPGKPEDFPFEWNGLGCDVDIRSMKPGVKSIDAYVTCGCSIQYQDRTYHRNLEYEAQPYGILIGPSRAYAAVPMALRPYEDNQTAVTVVGVRLPRATTKPITDATPLDVAQLRRWRTNLDDNPALATFHGTYPLGFSRDGKFAFLKVAEHIDAGLVFEVTVLDLRTDIIVACARGSAPERVW